MMLCQLLEQVDADNIGYPDDIIEKGVDETRRRKVGSAEIKEDWSSLSLAHSGCCENCKRVNAFADDCDNEMSFDYYETYTDNITRVQ